jgi:hypothetical protein
MNTVIVMGTSFFRRHCEPTGPRAARPDDRLREGIQFLAAATSGLLRRCAPRNDDCKHSTLPDNNASAIIEA